MRWTSRKLWLALLVVALATILLVVGKLSSAEWVDLIKWIGGGYFGANALAKFARVVRQ